MKLPYGLKWFIFLSIVNVLSILTIAVAYQYVINIMPTLSAFALPIFKFSMVLSVATAVVGITAINKRSIIFYYLLFVLFLVDIMTRLYSLMRSDPITLVSSIFGLLQTIFIMWYFVQLKHYFKNPKSSSFTPQIIKADKKINLFIFLFVIILIAISSYQLVQSQATRGKNATDAVKYTTALVGKSFRERNEYCLLLDSKEKDPCLLVAFSLTKNLDNITPNHCKLFSLETNTIVCYGKINRCDLAANDQLRNLCEFSKKAFEARAENKK